jgi:hypothetical protein
VQQSESGRRTVRPSEKLGAGRLIRGGGRPLNCAMAARFHHRASKFSSALPDVPTLAEAGLSIGGRHDAAHPRASRNAEARSSLSFTERS